MENYKVLKALGSGTWGVVHMAEQKETKRKVAIKKIKSERPEEGVNFTAVREIKLLRDLKHENIIELVDCFTTPDQAVCLVYECAFTDLEKILSNKAIRLSLADIKQHLNSLLSAVSACHERWILHRDLKLGNMFLTADMMLKIGDFGLATAFQPPSSDQLNNCGLSSINGRQDSKTAISGTTTTLCGTPNYIAPEVLRKQGHGIEADIWALGCMMYAMLVGTPPFETKSLGRTYAKIAANDYSDLGDTSTLAEPGVVDDLISNRIQ